MPTLAEIIWQNWFSAYDTAQDANKDFASKGTMQRYHETLASNIDTNTLSLISGLIENLIQPNTMQARFIPLREQHLANNVQPFLLSSTEDMRRRVLRHWHRLVSERGTKKAIIKLLNWLGLTATITEIFNSGDWDSGILWDDGSLWDGGHCNPCSPYRMDLIGAGILNESLWFGILSVIAFEEPINADLLEITYDGLTIYPIATFTTTYQTTTMGLHNPQMIDGGSTIWQFASGLSGLSFGYSPAYLYPDTTIKTVSIYVDMPALVTAILFGGQEVEGTFDCSLFVGALQFDFSNCANLTNLTFPISALAITLMNLRNVGLLGFNFSNFANLGGDIDLSANPQATTLVFAGVQSTNPTTLFDASNIGKAGLLLLTPLLFGNGANILIQNSLGLVTIVCGSILNTNTLSNIDVSYCPNLITLDVSQMRGELSRISIEGCSLLQNFTIGSAFVRPASSAIYANGTLSYIGTKNWSSLPINYLQMQGSAVKGFVHAANSIPIATYDLRNCINLEYYSLSPLGGLLVGDNSTIRLDNCNLIGVDVNSFLADIVAILVGRGEVPSGNYLGRTIYLDGTNGAAFGAGLTDIITLGTLGVQTYYN